MDDLLVTIGTEIPASRTTILVVDDDPSVLDLFVDLLKPDGYDVITAANGEQALELIESREPRVALIDKNLPDISGVEVIRRGRELSVETEFIVITGYASLDSAVEVMRIGVFDYIPKPLPALDAVRQRIQEALARNLSVYKYRLLMERLRYAYEELYKTKADLGVEKMLRDRDPSASTESLDELARAVAETQDAFVHLREVLRQFGNEYFDSLAESVEQMADELPDLAPRSSPGRETNR